MSTITGKSTAVITRSGAQRTSGVLGRSLGLGILSCGWGAELVMRDLLAAVEKIRVCIEALRDAH